MAATSSLHHDIELVFLVVDSSVAPDGFNAEYEECPFYLYSDMRPVE